MATEKRLIDPMRIDFDEVDISGCTDIDDIIYAVEKLIDAQPTVDAVEVVRCKDCKHCDPENLHCDHPMGTTFPFRRKPDDYCSYGERRNNG